MLSMSVCDDCIFQISCRHTSGVSVGFLHVCCVSVQSSDTSVYSGCFIVFAEVQIAGPIPQPLRFAAAGAEPIAFKLSRAGGHYAGTMFRSVSTWKPSMHFQSSKIQMLAFGFQPLFRERRTRPIREPKLSQSFKGSGFAKGGRLGGRRAAVCGG